MFAGGNSGEIAEIKSDIQYYKTLLNRNNKDLSIKTEELRKRNEDNEKISQIISTDMIDLSTNVISLESCFVFCVSGSAGMCIGLMNSWTGKRAIDVQSKIVKKVTEIEEMKIKEKFSDLSLALENAQKVIKAEIETLLKEIEKIKKMIRSNENDIIRLQNKLYSLTV